MSTDSRFFWRKYRFCSPLRKRLLSCSSVPRAFFNHQLRPSPYLNGIDRKGRNYFTPASLTRHSEYSSDDPCGRHGAGGAAVVSHLGELLNRPAVLRVDDGMYRFTTKTNSTAQDVSSSNSAYTPAPSWHNSTRSRIAEWHARLWLSFEVRAGFAQSIAQ